MDMETNSIPKLLLKLSPPVMLALLIQSIYNIVDSFFVAQYTPSGITAQSFPFYFFAVAGNMLAKAYFGISTSNAFVSAQGIIYTRIVFAGSLGLFVESICTKILQARGNMVLPMLAQVTGSVINVVLDIVLIFGIGIFPELGIMGAAIATVIGQWAAMIITLVACARCYSLRGHFHTSVCAQIYHNGIGSIITQSLYTLYIVGLNMILKGFTEDAVTVLGIYYKIQSFFFIPLLGFQQVLLPLISYNYGAGRTKRTQETLRFSMILACSIMSVATLIFLLIPQQLIGIFSTDASLLRIGSYALRVISLSFVFAGLTIVITSYLQGIAHIKASIFIIVLRQVFLLVPLAWVLHFFGLNAVWWTFPLTEIIAAGCGLLCILHLHDSYI